MILPQNSIIIILIILKPDDDNDDVDPFLPFQRLSKKAFLKI